MREDIINPDFPAEHAGENRDEPSLSPPAGGKEHTEPHSTLLPPSGESTGAPLDHWEQEKAKLSLVLTERLLRGRDTIAFSELMVSPLLHHDRLAGLREIALAVLRRHAREIIRQEKPLVLQSKRRFELDDAEIRTPLRELRDLLAERMVFDKNELHAALSFALRLQFDLITKSAAMLEKLIYQHAVTRDKDDIIVILQGLDENRSFVAHLQKLLKQNLLDHSITKEAFVSLCRDVEKEIYGRRDISAFVADLQTYQNFCASIGPSSYHRLEAQTVLGMLHQRGMEELAERAMPDLVQQAWWSIPEIEHLLEERMSAPPTVTDESYKGTSEPEVEFGRLLQESAGAIARPDFDQTDGQEKTGIAAESKEQPWPPDETQIGLDLTPAETPADLDLPEAESSSNGKKVAAEPATLAREVDNEQEPTVSPATSELRDITVEPSLEIDAAPLPPRPKIKYRYADDDDEPQIIERAKIEAQPPGPYPSFTRLVDEKSRRDFIKKIFHKDVEAYLAFIERLETIQTWKEAKAFLDHEFQQRRVNPYTREAVRLSDMVFSRYFAKGAR